MHACLFCSAIHYLVPSDHVSYWKYPRDGIFWSGHAGGTKYLVQARTQLEIFDTVAWTNILRGRTEEQGT